jgi:hypothetical protein
VTTTVSSSPESFVAATLQAAQTVAAGLSGRGAAPETVEQSVVPYPAASTYRAPAGGGVGGVLLVTALDHHHADVEGEGGDDQQGDDRAREQDEDLASLLHSISC